MTTSLLSTCRPRQILLQAQKIAGPSRFVLSSPYGRTHVWRRQTPKLFIVVLMALASTIVENIIFNKTRRDSNQVLVVSSTAGIQIMSRLLASQY